MDHSLNRRQKISISVNFEVVYHRGFEHSNSDAYFEASVFGYLKDVAPIFPIARQLVDVIEGA